MLVNPAQLYPPSLPTPSVASDLLEVESIYKLVEVTEESSVQFQTHWQQQQEDPQSLL